MLPTSFRIELDVIFGWQNGFFKMGKIFVQMYITRVCHYSWRTLCRALFYVLFSSSLMMTILHAYIDEDIGKGQHLLVADFFEPHLMHPEDEFLG